MKTRPVHTNLLAPKSTIVLQEYAHIYGGTYVPASFKNWKYRAKHIKIDLPHGLGSIYVTITDSSNSSNNVPYIHIKYNYRPRRKLECNLCSIKRPIFTPFQRHLRPSTISNSAINKLFHAKSSHPSLFRTLLKQDGLDQILLDRPNASFKIRIKEQRAVLTYSEACKKPDVQTLDSSIKLVRLLIDSIREQGIIYGAS